MGLTYLLAVFPFVRQANHNSAYALPPADDKHAKSLSGSLPVGNSPCFAALRVPPE